MEVSFHENIKNKYLHDNWYLFVQYDTVVEKPHQPARVFLRAWIGNWPWLGGLGAITMQSGSHALEKRQASLFQKACRRTPPIIFWQTIAEQCKRSVMARF